LQIEMKDISFSSWAAFHPSFPPIGGTANYVLTSFCSKSEFTSNKISRLLIVGTSQLNFTY
jgi:hypothetical protein